MDDLKKFLDDFIEELSKKDTRALCLKKAKNVSDKIIDTLMQIHNYENFKNKELNNKYLNLLQQFEKLLNQFIEEENLKIEVDENE